MPASAAWSEESVQDALEIIAEGLTELVGFQTAVINVRRDDEFVVVAVAGMETGHKLDGSVQTLEEMLGSRWPVRFLDEALAHAQDWGRFKFVHHDVLAGLDVVESVWLNPADPIDAADAWHPMDLLAAPIDGADGVIRGVITVDTPRTGRYPDAAQLRLMDGYADQAAKVVLAALEREQLRQQAALVEAAADLVRAAARDGTLEAVLAETAPRLQQAFAASGIWALAFPDGDLVPRRVESYAGPAVPRSRAYVELGNHFARLLWERQGAAAIGLGQLVNADPTPEVDAVRSLLERAGLESVLLAPLGAGDLCLGAISFIRSAGARPWSPEELRVASDIGRDLGRILLNQRALERERRAAAELRRLDRYKSDLIATVSHELKNPLTVLLTNLEMLEADLADDEALLALATVGRHGRRMVRLVDDLLLLARVADPDASPDTRLVDLHALAQRSRDVFATRAAHRGVELVVEPPDDAALVRGRAEELARLLDNLVSNAVTFTPAGGRVTICVHRRGRELDLVVSDTGIGIPAADRGHVFTEFFRSADPAARQGAGAGLGLAIVDRIARRHRARLSVESEPGRGSTFRVTLPAAVPDVR